MAGSKIISKINDALDFFNKIFERGDDMWVGIEGVINYTAKEGIDIVDALETFTTVVRPYVRKSAFLVERLIPDGTADAKLALFDRILKAYLMLSPAIDVTKVDKRIFAAARMLLEAMIIEKKTTGVWPVEVAAVAVK